MGSELTNSCLLCGSVELPSQLRDRTEEGWSNLCKFYQIHVDLKDVINTVKTSLYCVECLGDLQFVCDAYNKTDAAEGSEQEQEQLRLKEIQSNHKSKLQNVIEVLISNSVDLQAELHRVEFNRRNQLLMCMEVEPEAHLDAEPELEGSNEAKVGVRPVYYTTYLPTNEDDPPSCQSPLFSDVDVKPHVAVAHEATQIIASHHQSLHFSQAHSKSPVTPTSNIVNSKAKSAQVTRIPRNTRKSRSKFTKVQQSPKSKSASKSRVDRKQTIHISNETKMSDLTLQFNLKQCKIRIQKLEVSDVASDQESHPEKHESPEPKPKLKPEPEAVPITNSVESENTEINSNLKCSADTKSVNDPDDDDPDEEIDSETLAELERRYNLNEFSYDIKIIPDPPIPKPCRRDGENPKRTRSGRIIKTPATIQTQEDERSADVIDDSDGDGEGDNTSSRDSSASDSGADSDSDDQSETNSSTGTRTGTGQQKKPRIPRKIPDQRLSLKFDRAGNVIEPKFKCDTCTKQFFSNRELMRHVNSVHANPEDRPSFKCSHCDKTYTTKSHCRIHEETHDPSYDKNKRFKCPLCDQSFSDRKFLRKHRRVSHSTDLRQPFKCTFLNCKRRFRDSSSLQLHFSTQHIAAQPFPCDVCKREFKNLKSLTLHGLHRHSASASKDHVCCFCGKGYPCARSLKTHEKRHAPDFRPTSKSESDRLCDLCGAVLRSKNSMEKHMRLIHNRNPYSDSADAKDNDVNSLLAPSAFQKTFVCKYCEEAFVLRSTMLLHQQREHPEKFQFQCQECSFGASSMYLMDHHKLTKHSTGRPFKCQLCGNGFRAPKDLSRHMQAQHPASKDHKCPECQEAFVYKCQLKEHALMAHKKVLVLYGRPLHAARAKGASTTDLREGGQSDSAAPHDAQLSCEMCNRKYASELSLRRHNIKIHGTKETSGDGVENFKCEQCPSMFTCKKNLVYHLKVHDEEYVKKRLTCFQCGRTFSSPDTVRKHVEHAHSKQHSRT